MPKIRDLGINFIPATMRPPEIGPGGCLDVAREAGPGPVLFDAPGPEECTACTNVTCGHSSRRDRDDDCVCTACTEVTCGPSSRQDKGGGGYKAAGTITNDMVAQLKQQLQSHIGRELEN